MKHVGGSGLTDGRRRNVNLLGHDLALGIGGQLGDPDVAAVAVRDIHRSIIVNKHVCRFDVSVDETIDV